MTTTKKMCALLQNFLAPAFLILFQIGFTSRRASAVTSCTLPFTRNQSSFLLTLTQKNFNDSVASVLHLLNHQNYEH